MQVKACTDKEEWNAFVKTHGPRSGAFLQSWEWLDFQEAVGEDVKRFGVYEDDELVAVAGVTVKGLPFGQSYGFCPRGPIVKDAARYSEIIQVVQNEVSGLFFRFEPSVEGNTSFVPGAKESKEIHPAHTLITDLKPAETDLLKAMHHKTRYNIRLAGRKGVTTDVTGSAQLDDVWPVFQMTASRDKIRLHAKSYYEKMLEVLREEDVRAFIASASFDGETLGATIMIDFGNTRTYLHGASSNHHRDVMAPHGLHWALIVDAKAEGLSHYDWYGITTSKNPLHTWAGITRFKLGFSGEIVSYPGTFDLVQQKWKYHVYQTARRTASLLRSLKK